MEPRRLTEDRSTYTSPELVALSAASYYKNAIGHEPDEEKRAFFLAVAEYLDVESLWASIDYAVSVCGFGRYERDYWPHIQKEARRIWYEMHPEAKRPKSFEEKPPR